MFNFKKCCGFVLLLFSGCRPESTAGVRPSTEATPDLGAEVTRVFATKCSACHGPELAHPEGRFGYVLDLPKMRGNPELVIPGSPSESELWILVQRGEMPPADSPTGPLSNADQRVIKDWIGAGAPDARGTPETEKPSE